MQQLKNTTILQFGEIPSVLTMCFIKFTPQLTPH